MRSWQICPKIPLKSSKSMGFDPRQSEKWNNFEMKSLRRWDDQHRWQNAIQVNWPPEELKDLLTRIFANSRFCFQIDLSIDPVHFSSQDLQILPSSTQQRFQDVDRQFEMITIFTDFYLTNDQVANFMYIALLFYIISIKIYFKKKKILFRICFLTPL
jgi:hypothetical protein